MGVDNDVGGERTGDGVAVNGDGVGLPGSEGDGVTSAISLPPQLMASIARRTISARAIDPNRLDAPPRRITHSRSLDLGCLTISRAISPPATTRSSDR